MNTMVIKRSISFLNMRHMLTQRLKALHEEFPKTWRLAMMIIKHGGKQCFFNPWARASTDVDSPIANLKQKKYPP
jgi:hypothetical protein